MYVMTVMFVVGAFDLFCFVLLCLLVARSFLFVFLFRRSSYVVAFSTTERGFTRVVCAIAYRP